MRQVHPEEHYSNENNYSEPFEITDYRSAQSRCSFSDQDSELNIYSYNHLHETPLQTDDDIYDVAGPIFRSHVSSN